MSASLPLLQMGIKLHHLIFMYILDPGKLLTGQFWRLFTNYWFLNQPAELISTLLLVRFRRVIKNDKFKMYHFRVFERMMGSAKFVVLILVSFVVSILVQAASVILPINIEQYGPYFLSGFHQ